MEGVKTREIGGEEPLEREDRQKRELEHVRERVVGGARNEREREREKG